jgi:hypothetical protein
MSIPTLFAGEVQFCGYSDSHTQGPIVKFRLTDSDELAAFRAMTVAKGNQAGQRLMLAVALIGDGEEPEAPPEPTTRHPVAAEDGRMKPGPLCMEAILLCQNPRFREWCAVDTEPQAREYLLEVCGIDSRKELDTDRMAADRFVSRIRLPFMAWMRKVTG